MADENETVMLSRVKMMTADEGQTWDLSPRDRVALRYVLTTLARLTADLAAVTSDRDMWRSECESISAELDLPPGIRPAEGELRRMLGHNRALLAERDEARGMLGEAMLPLGGNTMETAAMFDLRARIAAHLGRSE